MNFAIETDADTLIVAVGLLLCTIAFGWVATTISRRDRFMAARWFGLGAIALFLALDELFNIHRVVRVFSSVVKPTRSSALNFLLLAIIGGMLFVWLYARFLKRLPRRTSYSIVGGGIAYFSGLVGGKAVEVLLRISGGRHGTGDLITIGRAGLKLFGLVAIVAALAEYHYRYKVFVTPRDKKVNDDLD